jgi:hypothetical protein
VRRDAIEEPAVARDYDRAPWIVEQRRRTGACVGATVPASTRGLAQGLDDYGGVESSRPASGPVPDWARQRRADDVAADAIRGSTAGNAIDAVARWAGAPDIGHAPVCRPTYTFCMSKLIAVRLPDEVLSRVDHERRRAGLSRAAAINAALELWIRTRRYDDAVRRDHEGYDRHPIRTDEFEPVLGAQRWPK